MPGIGKNIIFDDILDLDNFPDRLEYWVARLCNQFLPDFSGNQFETLHRVISILKIGRGL